MTSTPVPDLYFFCYQVANNLALLDQTQGLVSLLNGLQSIAPSDSEDGHPSLRKVLGEGLQKIEDIVNSPKCDLCTEHAIGLRSHSATGRTIFKEQCRKFPPKDLPTSYIYSPLITTEDTSNLVSKLVPENMALDPPISPPTIPYFLATVGGKLGREGLFIPPIYFEKLDYERWLKIGSFLEFDMHRAQISVSNQEKPLYTLRKRIGSVRRTQERFPSDEGLENESSESGSERSSGRPVKPSYLNFGKPQMDIS